MKFIVSHDELAKVASDLNIVFAYEDSDLKTLALRQTDVIEKMHAKQQFKAKLAQIVPLYNKEYDEFVVGLGHSDSVTESKLIKALTTLAPQINSNKSKTVSIDLNQLVCGKRTVHWIAQKVVEILAESLYSYDRTKTEKQDASSINTVYLHHKEANLTLAIETAMAIAHGKNVAKELGNLPGNICTPTYLANQASALSNAYDDISVEILDEEKIEALGMGAFMSVAKGSTQPGKLIAIHYKGAAASEAPHVLVGKGITFDTGGISLKPGAGMEEMKFDMCGAASVMGVMNTLGELKPNLNVIGVIAAAENMPAGNASKPGDVVTTMSGKTIEIINTDAEGRLVLCDALTWVEQFKPASVVDIATLTGAVIIALGRHPTAIYANDAQLQQDLLAAGLESWDRGWAMPLWDEYQDELNSNFDDFRNTSTVGTVVGSITAAAFLSKFTNNYRWAHLDIAGTGWSTSGGTAASGRPVAMLSQYLLSQIDHAD